MEFLGGRLPFTQFQEEKYQMLELNQRLESYLGHVKLLEEENKLLREEIHTLKSSKEPSGQRKAQEEALSQARRMLEEAWRKKDHVVLEVENLMEDIEVVSIQRQKAKNAKAEAQRKLMESRKELEEERRAQIWLREKAGQLEKDLLLQMQVHQENMETSQASLKQTKQVLMAPHPTQTTSIPDLGQEYSHRAAQAWQEATNNYQRLFGRLEESLNQAKANMAKIHQEKRENQHQVQHLAKELESTKTKRQMLEKNVVQQREEHTQELQHLQAQVDALELEKDNLGQQIDSLMVDRQNLLQAKMSLGLEVATYRALLDSEGLRTDRPTTKKTSSAFFLDVLSKPTGTRPASQTTAASCNVSNTVSTSHRSITSSRTLLTRATPSWSPTQGTPQRTPTRTSVTEKTEVHISEETEKAAEESVDHLQQEKVHEGMVLAITLPKTAAEPEPQLKPEDTEIKEDEPIQFKKAQVVECKTDASALISVSADQQSNLYQTPETESWAGPFTGPAGGSEEGKDEDTEVSFEMAQISHAPKVAWEQNKSVADDEKNDASEMDARSENISESRTFACEDAENDDETLKSTHISANTNIMGSSFLEQGTLDLVGDFGYHEDLMNVDKHDNVSNISEEGIEQMNSESEAVIDSINEWDRQEEIEPENEMKVVSPDSDEEEEDETNIVADTKDKKEDENVTEREEEIKVIKSDFSVLDEGVDSPKNSDHQESLEKTVLPTEPHSDQTVNEEDPLKPEDTEIKEDEPIQFKKAQMVECKTYASALTTVSADQPSNLYQTPETESGAGPFTDPAGDSEEGKDEDTEVCFEMAQISHTPTVAWEQNKTIAEDEKDDASEMDVKSENISESHRFAYEDAENDDDTLKSTHISANTNIMGSSFLEQGTLDLVGDFGYHEDLMKVDKQDNVSNISEEGREQMNSETEAVIDSINEWDRQEAIEPQNEMKVVSPDSEEEEENETNIVADTEDKKEDENVTEREEEEVEVIKSDFSVLDEGIDSPKNSDHQESLEKTVLPTELHSDQTVNEEDYLPEESEGEEENQGEDDDSPNITSWRTDPGEYDSYSQENTIADTRPLIRYKSDEETNGNVLTSHLISETSDSEDEKERMEGGHWNDSASKCFNTMEDLAEEPDLEVTGEMMTEDVVSKEEVQEGDRVCIMLQSDSEVHESLDMVEKESARIELKVNLEEDSDVIKEIRKDEDHNVKVYEQPQLTENQLMHTEQPEDETVHSYESQKHPISFPETSHQLKNLFETPSTLTMFQDSAATKDPEDFLDVSMHTSMDLTESRSLESKISSQPDNLTSDIPNSDQEEGNSSEDESPNASQCFQNTSLLKVATLNEQPFTFTNGVSKADSVSDVNNLPEEVLSKEKNTEEPKAAQIDDWENSNIWSKSINAPDAAEITHASTIDENTGVFPVNVTESLDIPNKMAENIFGKFEEHLERTVESFSEKVLTVMDFESTSSGEKEELQSKEKKSEIHSFFSTSMKEDFWSQGEMEMAANYDPAETEDLNQAMVFGEEWRDMEGMPMANVSPKEKMDILKGQDEKHKDEQPTQSKMVLSYDSVDEEDSWSSGDE